MALEAFEIATVQISKEELSFRKLVNIFLLGSLKDPPETVEALWTKAVMGLIKFNQTLVETSNQKADCKALKDVIAPL